MSGLIVDVALIYPVVVFVSSYLFNSAIEHFRGNEKVAIKYLATGSLILFVGQKYIEHRLVAVYGPVKND